MADNGRQAKDIPQLQHVADSRTTGHTGLPEQHETGIESRSGYAMDDVRVHYNSGNPAQLQAHAYAEGTDIHIAPGQEKHIPHEAWHVVQQKQGRVKPTMQMKEKVNINDDAELEKEADVMGGKSLQFSKSQMRDVNGRRTSQQYETLVGMETKVLQRVVDFDDESKGSRRGYTNTVRYKNELNDEQKAMYNDMHERQNREYRFSDADQVHRYLLSNGITDHPEFNDLTRGRAEDIFNDVTDSEAFNATGASIYLSHTQKDMNNWQRFIQLHRNNALKLIPEGDKHEKLRKEINQIYDRSLEYAQRLDRHEDFSSLTLTDSSGEAKLLSGHNTELSEPNEVKNAIDAMYEEAHKARSDIFLSSPSITVPRFGGTVSNGMGIWAFIEFNVGNSFPEGSSASGSYTNLPWEGNLKKRRTPNNQNVYIRGHLLNDHLGGPAASYNLVPLVGVDVPGAPNSNAAHSSIVEGQARQAFKTLSEDEHDGSASPTQRKYSGLRYFVGVDRFGGHDVSNIVFLLNIEKESMENDLDSAAEQLDKDENNVTLAEFKRFLGAGSLNIFIQQRYNAIWTGRYKNIMRTVSNTDLGDTPVIQVLNLINDNIDLWNWEADNLPSALTYKFQLMTSFGLAVEGSGVSMPIMAGPVLNPLMKYDNSK